MDISYLLTLQNFREITNGFLNPFMTFLSTLGTSTFAILIPALFVWCIDKKKGYYIAFSICIANMLTQFIKLLACVYRPWIKDSRITPLSSVVSGATGYSFPSGHTTSAAALYGSMAVSYRKKKLVASVLILTALLVGFSRNYVGVHTPQDVLAGLFIGGISIYLAFFCLSYDAKKRNQDILLSLFVSVIVIVMIIIVQAKSYPMDYINQVLLVDPQEMKVDFFSSAGCVFGLLLSWVIEKRFVNFSIEGSLFVRILRYIFGIVILLLLQQFVFPFMISSLGEFAGYFLRSIIVFVYVLIIYPICFQAVEKKFKH